MMTTDADLSERITSDNYPLHWAAQHGSADLVRFLAERYYDVNERDQLQGTTPLFWAAAAGHVHVARLLIEKGAAIRVANRERVTPLHATVANGHADMARLLIRHGASIHAKDTDGQTPLDWAKACGQDEIARVFEEAAYRESGTRKRDELARLARYGRSVGE
jgi:ankyrin repeat protein